MFQVLTFLSFLNFNSQQVIDFLKAAKKPMNMPIVSKWLTFLSFASLAVGYSIAAFANMEYIIFYIPVILFFVVLGTYFFFTQGTVALFNRLYRNKAGLLNGTTLVSRTNILFRLKDYARMLFLTSIISAVVLTAAGTVHMVFEFLLDMVANPEEQLFPLPEFDFQMLRQVFSLTLFIGLFISLLFFIVQGSILYLKLFTELTDTKRQLFALRRIGVTRKEAARILNKQIQFLFFIPFIVGSIHASFAFLMLSRTLEINLVTNALIVIGSYCILQTGYYLLTRFFYLRAAFR